MPELCTKCGGQVPDGEVFRRHGKAYCNPCFTVPFRDLALWEEFRLDGDIAVKTGDETALFVGNYHGVEDLNQGFGVDPDDDAEPVEDEEGQ